MKIYGLNYDASRSSSLVLVVPLHFVFVICMRGCIYALERRQETFLQHNQQMLKIFMWKIASVRMQLMDNVSLRPAVLII